MTAWGMAKLGRELLAVVPFVPSLFLPFTVPPFSSPEAPLTPLLVTPFEDGARAVSCRTSSITRRRSAGKEDTSPERRRARAWLWIVVGQLAWWACKE